MAAMVGVLACTDILEPGSPDGNRAFTGTWNGSAWSGRGYAVIHDDTLYLLGEEPLRPRGYDRYVRVQTPFRGSGRYIIDAGEGELGALDGDAGYFPPASGVLVVTSDGGSPRILEGRVWLSSTERGLPWKFEHGEFRVRVYTAFNQVPPPP